jgi:hypothetical protein
MKVMLQCEMMESNERKFGLAVREWKEYVSFSIFMKLNEGVLRVWVVVERKGL